MIIVTGEVRFGPGEVDRISEKLNETVAATRAEPGCEHYSYAVDLADPNLLHISERWADMPAIERHFATPHMSELTAFLGKAKVEAISIKAYEATYLKTLMGG